MVNPHTPRHVAVIRHMAFEDTGIFGEALTQRGWTVATLEAGIDDLAPALRKADLAVVLGGPIGVYETDRYPFLNAERAALEQRLPHGRRRGIGGRSAPERARHRGVAGNRRLDHADHACCQYQCAIDHGR